MIEQWCKQTTVYKFYWVHIMEFTRNTLKVVNPWNICWAHCGSFNLVCKQNLNISYARQNTISSLNLVLRLQSSFHEENFKFNVIMYSLCILLCFQKRQKSYFHPFISNRTRPLCRGTLLRWIQANSHFQSYVVEVKNNILEYCKLTTTITVTIWY